MEATTTETKAWPKMDADIKRQWVEALRSGKYPQAKKALRTDAGYCCLGCVADVLGCKWSITSDHLGRYRAEIVDTEGEYYSGSRDWLPYPLEEKASLPPTVQQFLAGMNDDRKSFAEIADFIDANL